MDKQSVRSNEPQQKGSEMTRGSESQNRGISRPSSYGYGISPSDFFRMSPFSLMRRMNEEISRVFGEFTGDGGQHSQSVWAPAIEVRQDQGKMKISAELPGMKPDDVNIEMTGDAMVIRGERREEREENQGGMHVSERRYGNFYRAVPLPEGAKSDGIKATFNNGLLEIDIPIEEKQSSARRIPIQSTSGQQQGSSSNKAA